MSFPYFVSGVNNNKDIEDLREEIEFLKSRLKLMDYQMDNLRPKDKIDPEECLFLESEFDIENNNVIAMEFVDEYGYKKAVFTAIINYQYQEIEIPCSEEQYKNFLNRYRTKIKLI